MQKRANHRFWGTFIAALVLAAMISVPSARAEETGNSAAQVSSSEAQSMVFTGAATHQVPIVVPPGRADLAPNLNLIYNSFLKNGPLGVGWQLDLGSIQRSTKFGLDYAGHDFTVAINGSKSDLVDRAADWGAGFYGAKIENAFSKYAFNESANYWTVTTREGVHYIYGKNANARQTNSNGTFQWLLEKVVDINGNFLEIFYIHDQGQVYPDVIEYTGHTSGLLPINSVEFYYEERPDPIVSYASHAQVTTAWRLVTIDVLANYDRARAYSLGYSQSAESGRSVLSFVQQFGADAKLLADGHVDPNAGSALPATTFTYQPGDNTFAAGVNWGSRTQDTKAYSGDFKLADVNGDNFMDMVYLDRANSVRVLLSNGVDGFDADAGWGTAGQTYKEKSGGFKLADVTGDGRDDFVYHDSGNTVRVLISTGAAFTAEQNWGSAAQAYDTDSGGFNLADVTGDGLADFIYDTSSGVFVLTSTGAAFNAESSWGTTVSGYNTTESDHAGGFRMADMNSDGLADLVFDNASSQIQVMLSDGTAFASEATWGSRGHGYDGNSYGYRLSDVNGDGLPDYIYSNGTIWVMRNTGNSFAAEQNWGAPSEGLHGDSKGFRMADVNSDGQNDFVYNGTSNTIYVKLSTGATFGADISFGSRSGSYSTNANPYGNHKADLDSNGSIEHSYTGYLSDFLATAGSSSIYKQSDLDSDGTYEWGYYDSSTITAELTKSAGGMQMADVNGDGLPDFLFGGSSKESFVHINNGEVADLLQTVTNQFGGTTSITYAPSSQYENDLLPFILQTVATITTDDGIEPEATTIYDHGLGLYDKGSREFWGFKNSVKTNPDGTTVKTWYHQDEFKKGKPYTIDFYAADGTTLLSRKDLTWQEVNLSGGARFVKLSQALTEDFDDQTVSSREDYLYDDTTGLVIQHTTSGTDGESVTTSSTYENIDATGWLWRQTKSVTSGSVSGSVRATYLTSDNLGNLIEKQFWLSETLGPGVTPPDTPETSFPKITITYDVYGNIDTLRDANSNASGVVSITDTDYDDLSHTFPVVTTYPTTTRQDRTGSLGTVDHLVYNDYDYRFGAVISAIDENDQQTLYYYDAFGRVTQVENPDGGQTLKYYDDTEFPRYTITSVKENSVFFSDYIDKYEYFDGFQRPIQTTTFGENNKPIIIRKYYNKMGRQDQVDGPYFGDIVGYPSLPSSEMVPQGATEVQYPWQKITFDDRGRPSVVESPHASYESIFTTYAYSGLATTITDPDIRSKTEIKDYLGRIIEVIEHVAHGEQHTYYDYNAAGDLLEVENHYGIKKSMTYDSLGRKVMMDDPDMGIWQYSYDANDNLKTQTDARGVVTTFNYDALNRLVTKSYDVGAATSGEATNPVFYTYDDPSIANGLGRLYAVDNTTRDLGDRIISGSIATNQGYDPMGRVVVVSKQIAGDPTIHMTGYEYDLSGKMTGLTYPDGYLLRYSYYPGSGLIQSVDGADLAQQLLAESTHYATYTGYEPTGKVGDLAMGNGTSMVYSYDNWSTRLFGLDTYAPLDPNDAPTIQKKSYLYSANGDMGQIEDHLALDPGTGLPGVSYYYHYDNLHRLIGETNSLTSSVSGSTDFANTYHALGEGPVHAVQSVAVSVTRDVAGVPVTEQATYSYEYDANGNMTYGPDLSNVQEVSDLAHVAFRTATYNGDNMPVQIDHEDNGSIRFAYDGEAVRTKKQVVGGSATYYVNKYYEVKDAYATKYIFAGDTRIAMVKDDGTGGGGETLYFHKDHLGSSTAMTDANGNKIEATEYLPYGMDRTHWSNDGSLKTYYKFTDQEQDVETGLYNYDARLYDPVLGIFVTPDSIVPDPYNPQSLNRYMYVLGNPLRYVDPSGHFGEDFHSNLNGRDYSGLDKNWKTSPYNPFSTGLHFSSIEEANKKAAGALANGDRKAFEEAMHMGQDSFAAGHKSVLGHIAKSIAGFLGFGPDPDDQHSPQNIIGAQNARNWTNDWEEGDGGWTDTWGSAPNNANSVEPSTGADVGRDIATSVGNFFSRAAKAISDFFSSMAGNSTGTNNDFDRGGSGGSGEGSTSGDAPSHAGSGPGGSGGGFAGRESFGL